MRNGLLCIIGLLLVHPWVISAQQGSLYFKHFSVGKDLPSNEVYGLHEDHKGYLWITSDRGIVRFDGYIFEEMPVEGMPAVYPWFGIYEDSGSDRLYFTGLKAQLAVYENGRLKAYPHNDKLQELYGYYNINSFHSRNDSVWLGCDLLGIVLITPDGKIIREPKSKGIYLEKQTGMHKRWIGKATSKMPGEAIPLHIDWGRSWSVDTFFLTGLTGLEWLQLEGRDLFFLGNKLLVYQDGRLFSEHTFQHPILSACHMEGRKVLIGFKDGGAILYQLQGEAMQPRKVQVWLADLAVMAIQKDKQGGVWLATNENGLYYTYISRARVWGGNGKISVWFKLKNTIYVGYQSGEVQLFKSGELVKTVHTNVGRKPRDAGRATLAESIVGEVTGNQNNPALPGKSIPDIFHIDIDFIPHLANANTHYNIPNDIWKELSARRITSILSDSSGRVWIGTYDGLFLYEEDSLSLFGQEGNKKSLFTDRIVEIQSLADGRMVVATLGNGLIIFRGRQVQHVIIKKRSFRATIINNIEVEGDTIWLATNDGISKVEPVADSFHLIHYGEHWGLPTLAINELIISDDWLYFRWMDRMITIEKKLLSNPLTPFGKPEISLVSVDGVVQNRADQGTFEYNQKEIKIAFNCVNLANGRNQLFRYRLKGIDEKWYHTTSREAIFKHLAPGDYVFELQAADAHGGFLAPTTYYAFQIAPALWQQWWFLAASGMLLLLLAYLYFQNRLRTVKRNNQIRLELVESQQRALTMLINPHFIFNILNTAQAAILKEEKMAAASIISRFAKLMRLSLELSQNQFVLLSKEIELLEKYLDMEMVRTPGKFVYHVSADPELDVSAIQIPPMLVQPFVENAIKHGVMHLTDRTGEIAVSFYIEKGVLYCRVSDNGVGRVASGKINKGRLRNHRSMAIDITCRRLSLMHAQAGTRYSFKLTDKYDDNHLPLGTVVIFSIPDSI